MLSLGAWRMGLGCYWDVISWQNITRGVILCKRFLFLDIWDLFLEEYIYIYNLLRRVRHNSNIWPKNDLLNKKIYPKCNFHWKLQTWRLLVRIYPKSSGTLSGEDDGDGDDDDGGDDGRIFPEHPSPILHAPRDNISRKDNPSLRFIYIHIYIYI